MTRHRDCRFLESITGPCEALALATPKEIPSILPGLLNCIRMIWSLSQFYNTEECLTGLLRKVLRRARAGVLCWSLPPVSWSLPLPPPP